MKQNSFTRLTFPQACPRKGGQGEESSGAGFALEQS